MTVARIVSYCVPLISGLIWATLLGAAPPDPSAPDFAGRRGVTLYVSKSGDNSSGASWKTALNTVQAAFSAVPDDQGGHQIIVRPDTYMEQDLHPRYAGAAGAYNVLAVDFEGSLGSGARGYAILDAGYPGRGSSSGVVNNFLQSKDVSGEVWDRWIVRHVYATGADAGVFWDIRQDYGKPSQPLTILVEDCVGIGRAFGGGVAGLSSPRRDEPVVFRRCQLWSLDWWGDAAGAYVRAENRQMPDVPDAIFEDCTLVGPDNAFQAGNPGFSGYTRVKFSNCRLVSLNISMPEGCPSTGIIFSTIKGEYLHVDLEDCVLMGYKVFGSGGAQFQGAGVSPGAPDDGGPIRYTVGGRVQAYLRFDQLVPEGFERLDAWPAEAFNMIVPSSIALPRAAAEK